MQNCFPQIQISKSTQPTTPPTHNLGFGQHFSDHMFIAHHHSQKGWLKASIEPYHILSTNPSCSVLHYAQSVFEGLKAFSHRDHRIALFRPHYHAERLQKSAEALCLPKIETQDFISAIKTLVQIDQNFIPQNENESLYIRPILFASEDFLGVRPSQDSTFVILTSPVGGYYGQSFEPLKIWVEHEASRVAPGGIGFAKASANYAPSLKMAYEAKKRGFHQVLWLDASQHQNIEEVGTMNIFFRIENTLITPKLTGTILAGCTRDCVITLAQNEGLTVEERVVTMDEIKKLAKSKHRIEAFGTGTAAVISPIQKMTSKHDEIEFTSFEMATKLYTVLTNIQKGLTPDIYKWLEYV